MERLNIKVDNLVGDYAIQLISVDGKVITTRKGENIEYQFIEQIDIEEFSSGIYSVVVKSDGISISKRVVISRGYR